MPDIMVPFWATLFVVPLLFQFGAGFTLIPRKPERWRSFLLPSATVLLSIPLAWLLLRILLSPVMTWVLESMLLFLLVHAVRALVQNLLARAGLSSDPSATEGLAASESVRFDAFPWLAVLLSLSLSWSFLSALLAAAGSLISLLLSSLLVRLVEWRSDLEHKSRGVQGLLLRLVIAILMVFFFLLVAQLLFPQEVLP